jgi:hypothetical protein
MGAGGGPGLATRPKHYGIEGSVDPIATENRKRTGEYLRGRKFWRTLGAMQKEVVDGLQQWGLAQHQAVLEQHEVTTIAAILGLSDSLQKELGLSIGARSCLNEWRDSWRCAPPPSQEKKLPSERSQLPSSEEQSKSMDVDSVIANPTPTPTQTTNPDERQGSYARLLRKGDVSLLIMPVVDKEEWWQDLPNAAILKKLHDKAVGVEAHLMTLEQQRTLLGAHKDYVVQRQGGAFRLGWLNPDGSQTDGLSERE